MDNPNKPVAGDIVWDEVDFASFGAPRKVARGILKITEADELILWEGQSHWSVHPHLAEFNGDGAIHWAKDRAHAVAIALDIADDIVQHGSLTAANEMRVLAEEGDL